MDGDVRFMEIQPIEEHLHLPLVFALTAMPPVTLQSLVLLFPPAQSKFEKQKKEEYLSVKAPVSLAACANAQTWLLVLSKLSPSDTSPPATLGYNSRLLKASIITIFTIKQGYYDTTKSYVSVNQQCQKNLLPIQNVRSKNTKPDKEFIKCTSSGVSSTADSNSFKNTLYHNEK
ncbi:TATA BOX ASSOCIATED FACTOR II 59 [Striga asiatica]|uniref:TATA BOX ASSOCIATED FACTOR II 59 n=1 Tax=Striga asiatica TaxID=4170 RepID=A0A5A7PT81_STRAF|nr:TATA BOX ASSOCIATED FACTOR II 59 [Striga asiatica]